jgi:hypothetical protein
MHSVKAGGAALGTLPRVEKKGERQAHRGAEV